MSMNDAASGDCGSDDVTCTVCSQDLSKGAIEVEEHPTVRGVAVCPRCLENLEEALEGRDGQPEDERCAWCGDDDGVTLFVCDADGCGRAFCDGCVDKLGEGTAAALEASDDPWFCPCCDETSLASLQALLRDAEQNPPLLARVFAKLVKDGMSFCSSDDGEPQSGGLGEKGGGDTAATTAANVEGTPSQKQPDSSGASLEREPALYRAGSSSASDVPLRSSSSSGAVSSEGGAGGSMGLGGGNSADAVGDAREESRAGLGEKADAFDQELIDAACVVDREISTALEQLDTAACDQRRVEMSAEIRKEKPHLSPQELDEELSADEGRVQEMWQYDLDALMKVQAIIKEAVVARGFSEAEVAIRNEKLEAEGDAVDNGRKGDMNPMEEDEEEEGERWPGAGGFLEHMESTAASSGGGYDTADALIHKCNSIWDTMQRRLASAENEGGAPAAESGQSSDASASTDNADVSSNPAFDLVFFKGSIKAVNMLSGLGVCWSDENAAAGAARAVAFFQGGQASEVDSPSMKDVEAWGLGGERAEKLGILIRWIKTQLVLYERVRKESLAPPRFLGEEGDEEVKPPADRMALLKQCRGLESQIQKLNEFWEGSADENFWASASDADMATAWYSLRRELHSTLQDAESTAPLLDAAGEGGLGQEACQAEDLGTSTEAWVKSTVKSNTYKRRLGSVAQATRKLKEAVAREGAVAAKDMSEIEDRKALAKERRKAARAGSKPRRPRAPRAPRPRKANANIQARKSSGNKAGKGKYKLGGGVLSKESGKRDAERRDGLGAGPSGLVSLANDDHGSKNDGFIDDSGIPPSLDAGDADSPEEGRDRSTATALAVAGGTGREKSQPRPSVYPGDGAEYMTQAPLTPDQDEKTDTCSDVEIVPPAAETECSDASGDTKAKGDAVWGGVCTAGQLAAVLRDMGFAENALVKPEGRAELETLLRNAGGTGSQAVAMFLERETKKKARAKGAAARISTLRQRDGPRGASCFQCSSTMPGTWKRMRKSPTAVDRYTGNVSMKTGKTSKPSEEATGGRKPGSEDFPAAAASGIDRKPGKIGPDRGGEGVEVSGKGKARASATGVNPRKAESAGVRPELVWVCDRDHCLESAKASGYFVEATYLVEHAAWTAESEKGPDRIARLKARRKSATDAVHVGATLGPSRPEGGEKWKGNGGATGAGNCGVSDGRDGSRVKALGFSDDAAQGGGKDVIEDTQRENIVARRTDTGIRDPAEDSEHVKNAARKATAQETDEKQEGDRQDISIRKLEKREREREAEAREACAVVLGKEISLPRRPGKLGSGCPTPTHDGGAAAGSDNQGGASLTRGGRDPSPCGDGQLQAEAESGERAMQSESDELSDGIVDCSMNVELDEWIHENECQGSEGTRAPQVATEAVCATEGCCRENRSSQDRFCPRCRETRNGYSPEQCSDRPNSTSTVPGCNCSVDGPANSTCAGCRKRKNIKAGENIAECSSNSSSENRNKSDARTQEKERVGGSGELLKPSGCATDSDAGGPGNGSGKVAPAKTIRKVISLLSEDEESDSSEMSPGGGAGGGRSDPSWPSTFPSSNNGSGAGPSSGGAAQRGQSSESLSNTPALESFWMKWRGIGGALLVGGPGSSAASSASGKQPASVDGGSQKRLFRPRGGSARSKSGCRPGSSLSQNVDRSSGHEGGKSANTGVANGGEGTGGRGDDEHGAAGHGSTVTGGANLGARGDQRGNSSSRSNSSDSDSPIGVRNNSSKAPLNQSGNSADPGPNSSSGNLKDAESSSSSSSSEEEDDEVLFIDVKKTSSRKTEKPLDERQELEVQGLLAKEVERRKKVAQRKFHSPSKPRIPPVVQSPQTPEDVEEVVNPDHVHVLEVLPLVAGESEAKVVAVPPSLGRFLYEHQVEGVQFMYDNLVVNAEQLRGGGDGAKGNGCILAHCMGLGKTLQAISIMHVLLTNQVLQEAATVSNTPPTAKTGWSPGSGFGSGSGSRGASTAQTDGSLGSRAKISEVSPPKTKGRSSLRTCLVLVPKNVLRNWEDELKKWLRKFYEAGKVFVVDSGKLDERIRLMERWHEIGGVLVMSYSIFRVMTSKHGDIGEISQKLLLDPGPDVVVADEAHLLKNEEAQVTVAIKKLRTRRRVALTGSPLQNNLVEYYTMVDFVRKGMLGDLDRFKSYFEAPILNGMLIDSSDHDVKRSHGRSHVLHETLRGFVQRKDVSVMAKALPAHVKKEEIVLTVALTKEQKALTQRIFRDAKRMCSRQGMLMRVLCNLQLVWTHPLVFEAEHARKAARAEAEALAAAELARSDDDVSESIIISDSSDDSDSSPDRYGKKSKPTGDGATSSAPFCPRTRSVDAGVAMAAPSASEHASCDSRGPRGEDPVGGVVGGDGVAVPTCSESGRNVAQDLMAVDQAAGLESARAPGASVTPAAPSASVAASNSAPSSALAATSATPASAACVDAAANDTSPGNSLVSGGGATVGEKRPHEEELVIACNPDPALALAPAASSSPLESEPKRPCLARGSSDNLSGPTEHVLGTREGDGTCAGDVAGGTAVVGSVTAGQRGSVVGNWGGEVSEGGVMAAAATTVVRGKRKKQRSREQKGKKPHKQNLVPLDDTADIKGSAKMVIALEIIARAIHNGDKVLVFSQRTTVLDFFERVLMTPGFGGFVNTSPPPRFSRHFSHEGTAATWGPWKNGKHYFRLDGSTPSLKRQALIDKFNHRNNKTANVFLLSTRAGNMGINLVAANRVILMDTSWNPANDLQAMFRCYRFGQTKPVEVYRLVMGKSLENKMHNKQITKHALSDRVVDAKNPPRMLTREDQTLNLADEYSRYEDPPPGGDQASVAAAAAVVTQQEAETLAIDNERLADILGIGEAEEGGLGQRQAASNGGVSGMPAGYGSWGGGDGVDVDGGAGAGRGVSPATSLLPDPATLPKAPPGMEPSEGPSPDMSPTAPTAATNLATSGARVGDGPGGGEGGDEVEDPVLAFLLQTYHPQFITSWVANKRLLEDDPLEKLDDADKAEATRQYDAELKLQQLREVEAKEVGRLAYGAHLPPLARWNQDELALALGAEQLMIAPAHAILPPRPLPSPLARRPIVWNVPADGWAGGAPRIPPPVKPAKLSSSNVARAAPAIDERQKLPAPPAVAETSAVNSNPPPGPTAGPTPGSSGPVVSSAVPAAAAVAAEGGGGEGLNPAAGTTGAIAGTLAIDTAGQGGAALSRIAGVGGPGDPAGDNGGDGAGGGVEGASRGSPG